MKRFIIIAIAISAISSCMAQLRPGDKTGINVFETPKNFEEFEGLNIKFGGGLTQAFQTLDHKNSAKDKPLMKLTSGFNNPSANLDIRAYLSDGITLNLEVYLASRHHHDTWVKGGFIQIDKVPFLKSEILDFLMYYTTVKIGQMDVNYGDAHFRRSDGGKAIYNPFIENYIMDGFATELGAEVDFSYRNFLLSASLTNGLLNPELSELEVAENSKSNGKRNPVLIAKLGYDKQFTEDFRFRITGSTYTTKGSGSNTLYAGDRTGSHYFGVMDPIAIMNQTTSKLEPTKTSNESPFRSGRYNPSYGDKVTSYMGNLFLKYKGLEWFSTLESAKGRNLNEQEERKTSQFATDLVYRFGKTEDFYVGARYNTVKGEIAGYEKDVKIDRFAVSAGWFPTKNLLTKVEYVSQKYKDFPDTDILSGGKFDGFVFQAVIGF